MIESERPEGSASQEPARGPSLEFPQGKKTDESWKEKARKEKERLADEARVEEEPAYPPASFLGIVEELSLRAMLALGQLRHPATGEVHFDLDAAKYAIDQLGVLERKTKGNLEPAEKAGLEEILHNLRLAFVHISQNPPTLGGRVAAEGGVPEAPQGRGEPGSEGPRIIL